MSKYKQQTLTTVHTTDYQQNTPPKSNIRTYTKADVVGVSSYYDSAGDRYLYTYYINDPSLKGRAYVNLESIVAGAFTDNVLRFGASDFAPVGKQTGLVTVYFNDSGTPQGDNSTVRSKFVIYVEFTKNILA